MNKTTKTTSKSMTGYFFEIYITGPAGEKGWDIACFYVIGADSMEQAMAKVKSIWGKKLDEVIQAYYSCINSDCKLARIEA
jgi:hypothetical protein